METIRIRVNYIVNLKRGDMNANYLLFNMQLEFPFPQKNTIEQIYNEPP